ncbi:hypothetical protein A1D18_03000 [Candidatus Rickettsiella isopodorum]|uniref:Uncharacterized protein n=1 Tax=Candidatus Rickettsiella isopodorum TaxID=1225476 RepID=A0A1J8NIU1_9COXI|nr:hypothetical protein [Candidatus Rickettsiella isopodorum]OIZ95080.1 hypothetical protein A1D18_03000 [Candidatus Rickettsiella isopodorum]
MPTSYVFDSALNLNKCFQNTPPLTLQINDLPKLPEAWLTELENKCRQVTPNLEKNIFFKHVGPIAQYKLKKPLKEQLSFLYYRVSGGLDTPLGPLDNESSKILLLELLEDIHQCTPGFHIRVNKLVNSLQIPTDLDQLLYLVRKSIILEIAAHLTNTVEAIYQVHVVDRVCRIAKKQGLAIEPNIQNDQYKSLLSGSTIRERLEEFSTHYTAFKIPFLLAEQLQLILNQHGYKGPEDMGYATGPAEHMLDIIQRFLTHPAKSNTNKFCPFFILDKFDEFGDATRIYDINWSLIRQLFFQKLNNHNYYTAEPQIVDLMDYAYYQALIPKKATIETETKLIHNKLYDQNFILLFDELISIQDKFPDYWKKLITHPLIIKNLDTFFNFLIAQPRNVSNARELLKKLNFTYTLFFSQNDKFILDNIIVGNASKKNLTVMDVNHNLLLKSIRYRPEITKKAFSLIFAKSNHSHQVFFNLAAKQNSEGSNLLMLAARYHTETMQHILGLLNQFINCFEKENITELFFRKNKENWNFISLAAKYRSDAMKFIFDFISENPYYFDEEILNKIFNQSTYSEWNFLYFLARYQTNDEVTICLDFISEKFKLSKNTQWLKLILNNHMGNILRLAAQSNLNALSSFLAFINQHSDHIELPSLSDFFLHSSKNNWNCLHAAARYSPSNLSLLLQFIKEKRDKFSDIAIKNLFFAQNDTGRNFLMLAAHYQTAAINRIIEFMQQQSQVFDRETLRNLFLQQNSDGWNFLSAAHNQPGNLQLFLNFILDNFDKFNTKTIKEIIFQKNKRGYTCLHLAVRYQPDSIKNILDFIDQYIDSFTHEFEQLLLAKNKHEKNLLLLSLNYQSDAAIHFLSFFNQHVDRFATLKNNEIFKKFICQTFLLSKDQTLIKTTLAIHSDLLVDNFYRLAFNEMTIPRCTQFFSLKMCCSKQLKTAAQAFKDLLKRGLHANDLMELKIMYPAVARGELGKLYQALNQVFCNNKETQPINEIKHPYRL